MKKLGKTLLLSKYSLNSFLLEAKASICFIGSRLLMNAVATVALIWASQFYLNIALMIMLRSTIALINLIIAISGDKFSTHNK